VDHHHGGGDYKRILSLFFTYNLFKKTSKLFSSCRRLPAAARMLLMGLQQDAIVVSYVPAYAIHLHCGVASDLHER
jgi:hypothetical protein